MKGQKKNPHWADKGIFMFGLIKFFGYFFISTCILSIPVNEKPLFYVFQKYSTPVAKALINKTKNIYRELTDQTNSIQNFKKKADKISSSLSSTVRPKFSKSPDIEKRKNFFKTRNHEHHNHGHYDKHEKAKLRELLKQH